MMKIESLEAIAKFEMLSKALDWPDDIKGHHNPIKLLCDQYLVVTGPSYAPDAHDTWDNFVYKVYNVTTGVCEFETRMFTSAIGMAVAMDANNEQLRVDVEAYLKNRKGGGSNGPTQGLH